MKRPVAGVNRLVIRARYTEETRAINGQTVDVAGTDKRALVEIDVADHLGQHELYLRLVRSLHRIIEHSRTYRMKAHIVPLEAGIVRSRKISGDHILTLLRSLKSGGCLV